MRVLVHSGVPDGQMEYYYDGNSLTTGAPRRSRCGYDVGVLSDVTENRGPVGVDGACVYDVSEVTTTDNGDVIATLSDTTADSAAYPFLKYATPFVLSLVF